MVDPAIACITDSMLQFIVLKREVKPTLNGEHPTKLCNSTYLSVTSVNTFYLT